VLEKGITIGGKPLKDHLEAVGHKDALDYVRQIAGSADPIRSEQTDVAVVAEFADPDVIEAEAKAAGHSAEAYSDFLADQALEVATRHIERTGRRN